MNMIIGSLMSKATQEEAKRRFVHRFTGDHKPEWAKKPMDNGKPYPLQFENDLVWLENTLFAVRKDGKLSEGVKFCQSTPTWPNGKE